jgi:hypothetical protein
LATVGVAGKQNIHTCFAHRIDDSQVWGVAHANHQVSAAGQLIRSRDLAEVVKTIVCVIDTDEFDAHAVDYSATLPIV